MIKKLLLLAILMVLNLTIVSCTNRYKESGYFIYEFYDSDTIVITGLTDSGKQQEYLIIPEKIDGHYVENLGETGWFVGGEFESENLKRLYIFGVTRLGQGGFFKNAPNLSHIFLMNIDINTIDGFDIQERINFISNYLYVNNIDYLGNQVNIANLTYKYNYDDAPNGDYYFIDDYDNDKVKYIPPVPTREGYIFDGWYKEALCLNRWNFDTDIIPKESEDYVETVLYAKWV